jgi:hypothetical protein
MLQSHFQVAAVLVALFHLVRESEPWTLQLIAFDLPRLMLRDATLCRVAMLPGFLFATEKT